MEGCGCGGVGCLHPLGTDFDIVVKTCSNKNHNSSFRVTIHSLSYENKSHLQGRFCSQRITTYGLELEIVPAQLSVLQMYILGLTFLSLSLSLSVLLSVSLFLSLSLTLSLSATVCVCVCVCV